MKWMYLLIFLLSNQSLLAHSEEALFCSYQEAKRLKKIYETKPLKDKTIHCTVSCKIAYKCSSLGSWHMGLFKEILDLFGKGNAEWADIRANAYGIRLSKLISNSAQCDDYCYLKYQP